jgi:glycosyltransferase involved in cell wall biosynthesis
MMVFTPWQGGQHECVGCALGAMGAWCRIASLLTVKPRKPLLSICIPTYQNAGDLRVLLSSLASEMTAEAGRVEVVVSDNCSSDETPAVVEQAAASMPVRYRRTSRNIGAAANIIQLCDELAAGEFAWLIGDDDVVLPGAVSRILAVLEHERDVDFVFVNTSPQLADARSEIVSAMASLDLSSLARKGRDFTDRRLETWEELLDPEVDEVFLGSLMCAVFRLSQWRTYAVAPRLVHRQFASLADTYPHSVNFAHTMFGRPAYYVGVPCTVAFYGAQPWLDHVHMIQVVRLQELLDLYAHVGVPRAQVENCRRFLLGYSDVSARAMILNTETAGRAFFSLRKFLWQNRRHPHLVDQLLSDALRSAEIDTISKPTIRLARMYTRGAMRLHRAPDDVRRLC